MTPAIIGIGGRIDSGKSTVGEYLCKRHQFRQINFADALKQEVTARLYRTVVAYLRERGTIPESCQDDRQIMVHVRRVLYFDRTPVTRALLQEYGTEVRRADDPDYWIKQWATAVGISQRLGAVRIVACDLRFPNEAQALKKLGGFTVRVTRPNGVVPEFGFWARLFGRTPAPDWSASHDKTAHASETSLDGWAFDYEIANTEGLDWLGKLAENLARRVIPSV